MTIIYVSSSVTTVISGAANTTVVGTLPIGTVNGNLLVAFLSATDSLNPSSVTIPAGWTKVTDNFTANGAFTVHECVAYKVYSSGDDLTFTIGANGNDDSLIISTFSGTFDPTNPITIFSTPNGGTLQTFVANSVTNVSANSVLLSFCAAKNGTSALVEDTGQPTGMTVIYNRRARVNSSSVRYAAAYEYLPNSGATGTRTWTGFTSANYYGAALNVIINGIDVSASVTNFNGGSNSTTYGQVNTFTSANFSPAPNSANLNSAALTNITATGATTPSLVDGQIVPLPTSNTFTLSNGVQFATIPVNVNVASGMSYVVLAGTLNSTNTGILFNFSPAPVVGDYILYPTANNTSVSPQGNLSTDYSGTRTFWHIEAATKIARSFSVVTGDPVVEPPTGYTVSRPLTNSLTRKLTHSLTGLI